MNEKEKVPESGRKLEAGFLGLIGYVAWGGHQGWRAGFSVGIPADSGDIRYKGTDLG